MHGTKSILNPLEQPIVRDIWRDKYAYADEASYEATCARVIFALCGNEREEFKAEALRAMQVREIVPAGRILAGAGTDKRVTLINCFVSPDIQDSMRTEVGEPGTGIMHALSKAAYTQQMGGGIGMDFSTIRPRGAVVKRTQSVSSGVLPFMDMWDAMCATIRSSGSRRGAMMATLGIWHPDIEEFIEAKQQPGRLTNFNVSVLVPDEFMLAVEQDASWHLTFPVAPAVARTEPPAADDRGVFSHESSADPGRYDGHIYKVVRARDLWDKITSATYVHAEPGVIFIDRINNRNNLRYCEHIHATNPCGEQPLPANGDCNLGHTNLAVMVDNPFRQNAVFNYGKLQRAAAIMVRLLDNVLDVTQWPMEEQAEEARAKRRIGLGITGLGSALQQLNIPYGSERAVAFVRDVMRTQAVSAYRGSCQLAKERGPFPLYDADKFCASSFVRKLDEHYKAEIGIRQHGIRNGVLLSVAPTGTTSIVAGNISSGIEPVFSHCYKRNVRGDGGEMSESYQVYDYGYLKWCQLQGVDPEWAAGTDLSRYSAGFVTADQLTVEQHLQMAAAAQEWVDAAISKTINCPASMTLDEFKAVYSRAYELGLKGCTTYRPDPRSKRGAVLEISQPPQEASAPAPANKGGSGDEVTSLSDTQPTTTGLAGGGALLDASKIPMQDVIEGRRYRIKWKHEDCAYYVQINDYVDGAGRRRPFELFINTKSTRHTEWVTALALMVTAIFRREGDPSFIVDELRSVFSAKGGDWIPIAGIKAGERRHVPSLVAAVGTKIEEHLVWLGVLEAEELLVSGTKAQEQLSTHAADLAMCERCGALAVKRESGCWVCLACGASDCG